MRFNKWFAVLIVFILAAGAAIFFMLQAKEPLSEVLVNGGTSKKAVNAANIPDWIIQDMQTRLNDIDKNRVQLQGISILQVRMKKKFQERQTDQEKKSAEQKKSGPELIAYANLDQHKGLLVLYAKEKGRYRVVYEKKEPICSVQIIDDDNSQIVLTTGNSENGKEENKLYVLRYTPQGYREVWDGIAHFRREGQTIDQVDGSVQFPGNNQLIYFELNRTLDSVGMPLMEKSSYQVFTYNEKKARYEK